VGGDGNDVYQFNIGYGTDTIDDLSTESERNTVVFGEGITPDDLKSFSTKGNRLIINIGTNGVDQLQLTNFNPDDPFGAHAIEYFRFHDGTCLTYYQLMELLTSVKGTEATTRYGDQSLIVLKLG